MIKLTLINRDSEEVSIRCFTCWVRRTVSSSQEPPSGLLTVIQTCSWSPSLGVSGLRRGVSALVPSEL